MSASRLFAQRAAEAAARQRQMEDNVLVAAEKLHSEDQSLRARQLRETAASIRDHRACEMEA